MRCVSFSAFSWPWEKCSSNIYVYSRDDSYRERESRKYKCKYKYTNTTVILAYLCNCARTTDHLKSERCKMIFIFLPVLREAPLRLHARPLLHVLPLSRVTCQMLLLIILDQLLQRHAINDSSSNLHLCVSLAITQWKADYNQDTEGCNTYPSWCKLIRITCTATYSTAFIWLLSPFDRWWHVRRCLYLLQT